MDYCAVSASTEFVPVFCFAASTMSEPFGGYIQGAGDDEEVWSMVWRMSMMTTAANTYRLIVLQSCQGLTPALFHEHVHWLLSSPSSTVARLQQLMDVPSVETLECCSKSSATEFQVSTPLMPVLRLPGLGLFLARVMGIAGSDETEFDCIQTVLQGWKHVLDVGLFLLLLLLMYLTDSDRLH